MTAKDNRLARAEPAVIRRAGLFGAAIFSGAFLIFLVQPMVGKLILPWFGGGPGVWTTCLMFYQAMLFLGYLYAHGLVRFFSPRAQAICHATVFIAAFLLLPVLPGAHWKPAGVGLDPSLSILAMLAANVGLPFVILAATGPLVQAWFARRYPQHSPYPLYAVSNFGSLSALLFFPLLVEPFFPMRDAAQLWSLGFGLAGLLILACGYSAAAKSSPATPAATSPALDTESDGMRATPGTYALWLLLPATAVILLMAITNKLCLDLASFPFLWILPLGLYLGSFILSFASDKSYRRSLWLRVALAALFTKYGLVLFLPSASIPSAIFWSMWIQVPLFGLVLFSLSMLLHGELYRLRPPPRSLTSFYIGVSGGGALGGLFVGLLAPWLFSDYLEIHVGYALTFILLFILFRRDEGSWLHISQPGWRAATVGTLCTLLLSASVLAALDEPHGLLHKERNFFGVHRVIEWETEKPDWARRILRHGTTVHGAQLLAEKYKRRPISYYGVPTGIGLIMGKGVRPGPLKIGIVGMGAGSLAAYGKPDHQIRFYEIDPSVIRIAKDDQYFTFLRDSPAIVEIIPGDARLSLEAEMNRGELQSFDLLVVDAFSSDAIPFHLMTLEAFALYLEHLAPDGLIAIHVSNRHFELAPVLYKVASALGLSALNIDSPGLGLRVSTPAKWLVVGRSHDRLTRLAHEARERMNALGLDANRLVIGRLDKLAYLDKPLWTDDFNSLLDILRSAK